MVSCGSVHMLNWTSEKPKRPGWYWYRDVTTPETVGIIQLMVDQDGQLMDVDDFRSRSLTDERYENFEWAGPLEPPS